MTRAEAIEAGARAIFPAAFDGDPERGSHRARASRAAQRAAALHMAAAVLDAIGWVEPVGYVIANGDPPQPFAIDSRVWSSPTEARPYLSERTYALVPVEGPSELGGHS